MQHLGYTMAAEVKVLRRKHKVVFRVGMRAEDLITALKHVPPNALVDEVLDGYGCEFDLNNGEALASIEFHEEAVEGDSDE